MKKFLGLLIMMLMTTSSCFAMTFSQPVKIGEIGFPVQAPYHGFIVEGATQNKGYAYKENHKRNGKPLTTYVKGTAHFGDLYCKYDFEAEKISESIFFGGKNDFVLKQDGSYKKIFSIGNVLGIKLYAIYHDYCVTDLKIIGTRQDGKWVVYVDSKKISNKYFEGKDAYKEDGGVLYDQPICRDDSIVVVYRRWYWKGTSEAEGEFRFKWNDTAQQFDVEQIIY